MRMPVISFLLLPLPLLYHVVDGRENKCDEGWTYHDNRCYIFRNEYETIKNAIQTCGMLGGQLAYAYDQKTLDFLTAQVKSHSNYAWWYGVTIDSYDHKLKVNNQDMPNTLILPNTKQLTEPTTGCVALLKDDMIYSVDYLLISTPCQVKLSYACRGDPSLLPKSVLDDKSHTVVASSFDVYWFSDILDKRTYNDAQKACIEKSMTLISIRDKMASKNISKEMSLRQHHSVDPWWIGLSVTDGLFSWTSGVDVLSSVLLWTRYADIGNQQHHSCRILLEEGTMDERTCYYARAPFICARYPEDTGMFGCPPRWIRAGQSCYYYPKKYDNWVSHAEASELCAKSDSHLISIDTLEEKIWLLDSSILKTTYDRRTWTSLNDKEKLNDFRWADGSKPSGDIVQISKGFFEEGSGKCFTFIPDNQYLERDHCYDDNYPGCQYKSQNGQCVSNYWKFFNGYCYYMVDYSYGKQAYQMNKAIDDRGPYHSMLQKCYGDVVQYDSSITVQPLKIDSKDVMNFISHQTSTMWIGLTEKGKRAYQWADGSAADMSLFDAKTTRVNTSTYRCVSMGSNGLFKLHTCDSELLSGILCEKEIPYHHNS